MSKTEQFGSSNSHKYIKNDVFVTGMGLAKPKSVNLRLTHKELTLILGIVVALIVAVTLWMNYGHDMQDPKKSDAASSPVTGMLQKTVLRFKL